MVSLLPSDEELASFCKNNCLAGTRLVRFSDTTIIKFGLDITPAEAATQRYVWEHANQDIFHIPEPYRFFQDGPIGYLVMEYLVGTSLSTYLESASSEEQINLVNSVMEALDHLATLPVPLKQGPGPAGGGSPRGYLWSDTGLSTSFASIFEMESWLNHILLQYQPGNQTRLFDFTAATLVVCHTDLAPRNLLRLDSGKIALLDWGSAGFYPPIFEIYALRTRADREPFFASILDRLRLDEEQEGQIQLLAKIEQILLFYGDIINSKANHNFGNFDLNFDQNFVQKSSPPPFAPKLVG